MDWKSIITRGVLTFLQAFLAVIIVTGIENVDSWETLKPAVVAAVAALLSFIYNTTKQYASKEG